MFSRLLKAAGYLMMLPVVVLSAYVAISAHQALSTEELFERFDFSTRPIEIYPDPTDPNRSCIRNGDDEECLLRSID